MHSFDQKIPFRPISGNKHIQHTQTCTKSQKEQPLCSELHTVLSWCRMWTTKCCSNVRPVSARGSLTCSTLLWKKCEEGRSYQPLKERNAPVCELEKFVHSVIILLTSNFNFNFNFNLFHPFKNKCVQDTAIICCTQFS